MGVGVAMTNIVFLDCVTMEFVHNRRIGELHVLEICSVKQAFVFMDIVIMLIQVLHVEVRKAMLCAVLLDTVIVA